MNNNPEITIKHAHGNKPDDSEGAILKRCYFQARRHDDNVITFRLHQPDGEKIKTEPHHLKNGEDFTFTYDGLEWSVTNFLIEPAPKPAPEGEWIATGNWSAKKKKHTEDNPADDDPETGTFQAQSGGGAGEYETSASASA